jgi:hypothetical protein
VTRGGVEDRIDLAASWTITIFAIGAVFASFKGQVAPQRSVADRADDLQDHDAQRGGGLDLPEILTDQGRPTQSEHVRALKERDSVLECQLSAGPEVIEV